MAPHTFVLPYASGLTAAICFALCAWPCVHALMLLRLAVLAAAHQHSMLTYIMQLPAVALSDVKQG